MRDCGGKGFVRLTRRNICHMRRRSHREGGVELAPSAVRLPPWADIWSGERPCSVMRGKIRSREQVRRGIWLGATSASAPDLTNVLAEAA